MRLPFARTALLASVFFLAGAAHAEKLIVGATQVPHAEILEVVKPALAKDGVEDLSSGDHEVAHVSNVYSVLVGFHLVRPHALLRCQMLPDLSSTSGLGLPDLLEAERQVFQTEQIAAVGAIYQRWGEARHRQL